MDSNKNIPMKNLDNIFDNSLKTYLSSEKHIFEYMVRYEAEPSDLLKDVLLTMISDAKKQVFVLLGIISDNYTGEMKITFSNKLGAKLNELHELEEKLILMSRSK